MSALVATPLWALPWRGGAAGAGPSQALEAHIFNVALCLLHSPQIPDEEDEADLTQEEMEALEEDMQNDFEIAEMIK